MSKKKGKVKATEKILLLIAILELTGKIIDLIKKLIE